MTSFFTNTVAKKDVLDLYYTTLSQLDTPYELLTVETSFGDTNIIVTGQVDQQPLLLLHGANSCAPIALNKLQGLTQKFRVYAIDLLGFPNLSAENRLDKYTHQYGKWMYEIIARLNIYNAILVGIALGGFVCCKSILFDSSRIAQAILINPAGFIKGNYLQTFANALLPILSYKWTKDTKYLHCFFDKIFTSDDSLVKDFLKELLLNYSVDFSSTPLFSNNEIQAIDTPISIIASERDIFFPGKKLLQRAKTALPSFKKGCLLKDAKHMIDKKDHQEIIQFITEL